MELLGLICSGIQSQLLYIDPAATSVLLSSVAAIAVAIAASAIIIWKKVKNNVKKIMKTDPNKNKEVEKDVVLIDEENSSEGNEKETDATETATETEASETKTETEEAEKETDTQVDETKTEKDAAKSEETNDEKQDQPKTQNQDGDNGEDKK